MRSYNCFHAARASQVYATSLSLSLFRARPRARKSGLRDARKSGVRNFSLSLTLERARAQIRSTQRAQVRFMRSDSRGSIFQNGTESLKRVNLNL